MAMGVVIKACLHELIDIGYSMDEV